MKTLDMTGKSCPLPVIEARKILLDSSASGVLVKVDNAIAVSNLKKLANSMNCDVQDVKNSETEYLVEIKKKDVDDSEFIEEYPSETTTSEVVIMFASNQLGSGEKELGETLIKSFIFSVSELPNPPSHMIFINSGAFLTTEGSNVIEILNKLSETGTTILTCGACLNYYELTDKLAAGEIADMYRITNILVDAPKLIRF